MKGKAFSTPNIYMSIFSIQNIPFPKTGSAFSKSFFSTKPQMKEINFSTTTTTHYTESKHDTQTKSQKKLIIFHFKISFQQKLRTKKKTFSTKTINNNSMILI